VQDQLTITKVEPFLLHVPVTGNQIADSTHRITHWGVPGVIVHTAGGLCGYGYTGTHAHVATDRLITACIAQTYGPLLEGQDARDVQRLSWELRHFPPVQWVGRCGITQLALAAVDIALWDLKAKAAGLPLWKLLGGLRPTGIEAYNSDGGWLSLKTSEVVDNCRRFVEQEGFRAVKIKIGSSDPLFDLRRIEAVRAAVGPSVKLMVDGNGKWDLPTAMQYARQFSNEGVYWFEEPLWYDDVTGHAQLARATGTPIALGEQLYSLDAFATFVQAGAVHFIQADVTRLGGITEWQQVADLSLAHRLPVAPHAGDMGQVHIHLALAHPACTMVEYIPWIRHCFEEPIMVKEGRFIAPQQPGVGTTVTKEAFARFGVKC
jgi:L-alanine-DL-glutamate epimerase-like enolase superfamily enzyme